MRLHDLSGKKYGRWSVLAQAPRRKGTTRWLCICDCGVERVISAQNLTDGKSKSCGCFRREYTSRLWIGRDTSGAKNPRAKKNILMHGENYIPSSSVWYKRAAGLFYSARRRGVTIGFKSVFEFAAYIKTIAPAKCPVFGVPFSTGGVGFNQWSPSVDKKDPSKGYVPGNIQIISMLANCMKRDATPAQLVQFADWILRGAL